jgi:hypothetical protein
MTRLLYSIHLPSKISNRKIHSGDFRFLVHLIEYAGENYFANFSLHGSTFVTGEHPDKLLLNRTCPEKSPGPKKPPYRSSDCDGIETRMIIKPVVFGEDKHRTEKRGKSVPKAGIIVFGVSCGEAFELSERGRHQNLTQERK